MIKRYAAIILCLAFVSMLFACTEETPVDPVETLTPQVTETPSPAITFAPAEDNVLNNVKVEFVGADIIDDADFNTALRIYVHATNLSEETARIHSLIEPIVFQGDEPLEFSTPLSMLRYDGVADLSIRPGTSVRFTEVVTLKNLTDPVTISYYDFMNLDSATYITETFDIENLPGKPDPFFVDLVPDPEWTKELSDSATIGDFVVGVKEFEKVQLLDGKDGIRIYIEFINNSEFEALFSNEFDFTVFQDNVELKSGYPMEEITEDTEYDPILTPHSATVFTRSFELTSDSPIEFEASGYWQEGKIGGMYKLK
ncbi:MAG: DUF5067 domain-containing protein [Clostridia bacterium]|nr:DUF5067 domain-containing protein [Clostridia bacterium]